MGAWLRAHAGASIAISESGEKIVVGAPLTREKEAYDAGAAYVFNITDGVQLAKLVPDDSNDYEDQYFGAPRLVLVGLSRRAAPRSWLYVCRTAARA